MHSAQNRTGAVADKRLQQPCPLSYFTIACASPTAVGRDTIMRAVASAVLQVDSLEQALLAALPLGPQTAAGGISLPEFFKVSAVCVRGCVRGARGCELSGAA